MSRETGDARGPVSPPENRKGYKGVAMEGFIARWYAKTTRNNTEQYKSWAKIASGHIFENGHILELAPGPGYLSIEIAKLGKYEIVGLDISKTFVNIASEQARAANVKIEFRQGDAAYTPFPSNTFDFVICTSAFKNFPEPVRVIDEIFRILKRTGEALIIDLRKDASKVGINDYVNSLKLSRINSFWTRFTFNHMLLRSAYTKLQFQDFAARSLFGTCKTVDQGIGLEVWFQKP